MNSNMLRSISSRLFSSSLVKSNLMLSGTRMSRGLSSDSESDAEAATASLTNIDTLKCINRVTLLGRATGPVLPNASNQEMATFILATNEIRRNKADELIKRSEFHRVQIFIPRLAQKAKRTLDKGSRVLVDGKISYNVRRGVDGTTTNFTNIIADNIVFITGKQSERGAQDEEVVDEGHEKMSQ